MEATFLILVFNILIIVGVVLLKYFDVGQGSVKRFLLFVYKLMVLSALIRQLIENSLDWSLFAFINMKYLQFEHFGDKFGSILSIALGLFLC